MKNWVIVIALLIIAFLINKQEVKTAKKWLSYGPLETYCSGRSVLAENLLRYKQRRI